MTVIETAKLIFSDSRANNNKFWYAFLHDDGLVVSEWGRVGVTSSTTNYPYIGKRGFDKKVREKLTKGYTMLQVVDGTVNTNTIGNGDLHSIAHEQIAKGNPTLIRLVDQLVRANVHQITGSTKITYNASTGLFSTPLGIVTPDAISQARSILDIIARNIQNDQYSGEMLDAVNSYMRLIPQNVGMKIDVRRLFPNIDSITHQNDILDSLDASYLAVTTNPQTGQVTPRDTVFSVNIDVLSDKATLNRINQWFESSKKSMHGYDKVRVVNAFSVTIGGMADSFLKLHLPGKTVEVFHGTSQANCLSILKSGLKIHPPSTARLAGTMFGNGVYGAVNSSKSLGYTYGRWGQGGVGDSGWLFICDFKMGKTYEVTRSCQPLSGYDSIWAKAGASLYHDELIVYKENQVNIKYLLECK